MKIYFLLLMVFASVFYLSQNTTAGTVYGSIQPCYYGANCAQQGYSTPGEVYCPAWFAYTDSGGNQVCNYGTDCCGSLDYCSQTLWNNPQPVPSACTPANCYYINQVTCTGGRQCSLTGCVCPYGTTWDGTICKSAQPPLCTANLIISSTGTGTCTVAGSVINAQTGCSGQTFEIKDSAGNSKCSGIISGTSGSCPSTWTISASTTYNLFIGGSAIPSDTQTAQCVPCSSYTSSSACSGGGCYWCASPNTPSNTCVQSAVNCAAYSGSCSAYNGDGGNCNNAGGCYYCAIYGTCLGIGDTSCPGYVDCSSYTSQSACTMDGGSGGTPKPACGWCPNSYNGGTNPNGGTCYAASVLASKCGSCFIAGAYNIWSYYYCRDACPYAAPTNGYSSGWCTMGNVMSTGNENCGGNKFDVSKSSNGVVDCGECAINANGQDCGGTAVNGYMIYNGKTYAGNEAADVYGGASVAPYDATRYSWCGRGICTTSGGYAVRCSTHYQNWGFHCPSSLIDHPNSNEILCGSGGLDASCEAGCGGYYAVNTCNAGDTCVASGGYYGGGKCCPAAEPYYNSADGLCYSQHGALGCTDGVDNDRNCLIDCADPACANGGSGSIIYNADGSTSKVCAGATAKQSCNAPGNTYGPCGSCPGGQACVSGVCRYVATCSSLGKTCGSWSDGAGGTLNCGACAARECFDASCNSGTCAYSPSSPGTPCTGGKCYAGSCDKWPPSTTISLNPAVPNGINGWYVSAASVSITCTDVGSGCNNIYYSRNSGGSWSSAAGSFTGFSLGDGSYGLEAYSTDNAGSTGAVTPLYLVKIDSTPPSVSVSGAPAGWTKGSPAAGVSCSDSGSGCSSGTYRIKTYPSNPGYCSSDYNQYALAAPQLISSHVWVCAAAKDNAGNAGFSTPAEFKVDNAQPSVSVIATPFPPCTLNPLVSWIDCSATIGVGCSDADSGCAAGTYGYKIYDSNPGTCPSSKSYYSSGTATVAGDKWTCAYAEDIVGNGAASSPTEIKVDKTFTIIVAARAYGDINVPAGTEVKAYLCLPSQYYCNHDAAYIASGSGIVGADKKFSITLSASLERGQKYKVGIVTEKGYAESEFTA